MMFLAQVFSHFADKYYVRTKREKGYMKTSQRLNLLKRLVECGEDREMPNGEKHYFPPDVYFRNGHYKFCKGWGSFKDWLVDKHGVPVGNDSDTWRIDFRLEHLAKRWGIDSSSIDDNNETGGKSNAS